MTDVVVVGAGLAGLTAATRLVAEGQDVTVLEARRRVGGRTHGVRVADDAWVDAGAAYLGARHTALTTLLEELGLKTMPTSVAGDSRFDLHDATETRAGRFPPLDAVALGTMFDQLDDLVHQVRVDAPARSPGAAALDALTAAEWADEFLAHPDIRLFFPLFLGEMMAADPADVSVLHMAFYLRSGGGLRYLNAFEGGAQDSRVRGGAHRISELLAAELGDRVRLGEPVHAIHQDATGVDVHTAGGRWRCATVVVAVPPLLADEIAYEPVLPALRSTWRTGRGCAIKVQLVYPRPVWTDHGLSGWSVSARGPLLSTVDDSPEDGPGVLTGFVTGQEARRFGALPAARQRREAAAQAARLFPELPAPSRVHVTDWVNDPYSRGCYAALFGPGDWIRLGPHLTTPHGRVHWAGTETSTVYFGLMEGAIRSGHRVAAEISAHHRLTGRSR